ncbi:MAG TPA: fluoride efflux transporter CrcB [Ignavibacteriaceae bacterium]|nr:fluoride efflux transporter CrcB [Ignavibacteriaceae bacterium]HPO56313.1 fluoride efflux transporter CrcB [Ignavibacteriaceae bacterium]
MKNYLLVFLGSALGGVSRYFISNLVFLFLPPSFPFGTLAVNIIGSLLLGFTIFLFELGPLSNTGIRIFLTVGFCGGLTTFSTFSLETVNLLRNSEYLFASLNILANVLLSIIALIAAYYIVKLIYGV